MKDTGKRSRILLQTEVSIIRSRRNLNDKAPEMLIPKLLQDLYSHLVTELWRRIRTRMHVPCKTHHYKKKRRKMSEGQMRDQKLLRILVPSEATEHETQLASPSAWVQNLEIQETQSSKESKGGPSAFLLGDDSRAMRSHALWCGESSRCQRKSGCFRSTCALPHTG